MFCAGTRDLRVASYWIDTLVLKNRGKYLRYFTASSSSLRGNPTQCSRGSKKDFWRHCRGGLRKSQHTKYPSQTLISRITLFAICLSFSSPPLHPCRFIRPLSLSTLSFSICLFFARLLFVCLCVGLLIVMASPLSSPLSPKNEILNFKQREGENLKDAWYRMRKALVMTPSWAPR